MVDPDKRLVRFAQHGNKAAFGKLVRKYRDQILEVIYDYLRDYDEAKDVAQEVFMKAFRNIRDFEEKSLFSSWLYRIAVNASYDALKIKTRQKKRHKKSIDEKAESQIHPGESNIFDDEIIQAIDKLSENQHTAIILRYFHHKSIHEIAEVLNCAESTVRIHLHRAIQKLQKDLKQEY
jgi:RNA polymerase sigma-70 factor (ECF subfamily)